MYLPDKTDADLVLAAQAGDADSFLALCERHYAGMVALAAARLRDPHAAEDVAQDTFAKACRSLKQLRDPTRFGPWLAAICRRQIIQHLRRQAAEPPAEPLQQHEVSGPSIESGAPLAFIREVVGKLPEPLLEVVYFRYYADMSYEQIAELLGTTRQTVNGRLRRAKTAIGEQLRRRIGREGVIDE
jgi:RNA polymerase sigma-70 factor (ECF subfamily)